MLRVNFSLFDQGAVGSGNRLQNVHLLIVEDEPLIALDVATALVAEGATAHQAREISQALETIKKEKIDCAVCDLKIQDDTSYSLIDALLAMNIPVIVYTGLAVDNSRLLGSVRILDKPVEPPKLIEAVCEAVTGSASRPS